LASVAGREKQIPCGDDRKKWKSRCGKAARGLELPVDWDLKESFEAE
jgi:hypothetical protein